MRCRRRSFSFFFTALLFLGKGALQGPAAFAADEEDGERGGDSCDADGELCHEVKAGQRHDAGQRSKLDGDESEDQQGCADKNDSEEKAGAVEQARGEMRRPFGSRRQLRTDLVPGFSRFAGRCGRGFLRARRLGVWEIPQDPSGRWNASKTALCSPITETSASP